MTHAQSSRRFSSVARGLTLVEMTISILLVGIMLVGALQMAGASKLGERTLSDRHRAHQLAHELMDEIFAQPYADESVIGSLRDEILIKGTTLPASFGPDIVEITGTRILFDDVGDYAGWSASPPQEKDGTLLTGLSGWTRTAEVELGSATDPTSKMTTDEGVRVVTVTVARDGEPLAELVALRTLSVLPSEACLLDTACYDLEPGLCIAAGGTPMGIGTSCFYDAPEKIGGGVPPKVLFVVGNPASLTSKDTLRKTLIEAWGMSLTLIDDSASQADFDTAAAEHDVAYVSPSIAGGGLLDKLTGSPTPIVNEFHGKLDNFGFSQSTGGTTNADGFDKNDPSHYITSPFGGNPFTLFSSTLSMPRPSGTMAPDLQYLAATTEDWALVALEAGAQRWDGNPAPARRVHLPFANADTGSMTTNAETLVKRSIEWAAGFEDWETGGPEPPTVLFVVADASSLTAQEDLRRAYVESWDLTVEVISDDAAASEFDTAVSSADVAYVSGDISAVALGTKLTPASIGVVSEEHGSAEELGFGTGSSTNDFNNISIVDDTHYITEGLGTGWHNVFLANQSLQALTGSLGPETYEVAQVWTSGANYDPGLLTLDPGAALYGGGTAAGRRVSLPWGGSEVDFSQISTGGETILKRSLEWAGGFEVSDTGGGGDPEPCEMYVHDIGMGWRKQGQNYYGQATIWVKDDTGADVAGATVTVQWSGAVSGSSQGVTGSDGKIMLESSAKRNGGTFTCTVTDVIESGCTHNPSLDVETTDSITAP